MKRAAIAIFALAVVLAFALGRPAYQRAKARRDAQRAVQLDDQLHLLYERGDWPKLLEAAQTLVELRPTDPSPQYDLACAHARLGHRDAALTALERSVERGQMASLWASTDEHLETLRAEPRFAAALEGMRQNAAGPATEPAGDVPGLGTVEGYARDGFRYRLRLRADAGTPQRLVVWLHPSNGSFNTGPEQLAPKLAAHGWATLVITRMQQWEYWSDAELAALLERTVPEAGKTPGIDARRPVLLGYSGGGQELLWSWQHDGGFDVAGLALVAAFPVDPQPHQPIPFFARYGADEGWSVKWDEAEPLWRDAGIPLHLERVPGAGHGWLLEPADADGFLGWLDALPR